LGDIPETFSNYSNPADTNFNDPFPLRYGSNLILITIKQSRMKNDIKNLKPIKGRGEDLVANPLPPGTMYVVCLNTPLINLWKLNNFYSNESYNSNDASFISGFSKQGSFILNEDRVYDMLTLEEELLLYNDGLSENQ
jgi:hypothetical protein